MKQKLHTKGTVKPRHQPVWQFFIPFFLLVLSGTGLWYSGKPVYFGIASKSWPTVQGRVVQSVDGERWYDKRAGRNIINKGTVTYEYEVAGKVLTGSRVSFSREAVPQHVTNIYPADKPAMVYYDASAPGRSVLMPGCGPDSVLWLYLWATLFTVLVSLYVSVRIASLLIIERFPAGSAVPVRQPKGLTVRRDGCYADGTFLRLDIPRTRTAYGLYLGFSVTTMLMTFPAWFVSEGRIPFFATLIAAVVISVIFIVIHVKGLSRLAVIIDRKEVVLFNAFGRETANSSSWNGNQASMPIQKIESIVSNGKYLSVRYFNPQTKRMARYITTSAGLEEGAICWLAELLRFLQSHRRTSGFSTSDLPVWKLYGFESLSDFLCAVAGGGSDERV